MQTQEKRFWLIFGIFCFTFIIKNIIVFYLGFAQLQQGLWGLNSSLDWAWKYTFATYLPSVLFVCLLFSIYCSIQGKSWSSFCFVAVSFLLLPFDWPIMDYQRLHAAFFLLPNNEHSQALETRLLNIYSPFIVYLSFLLIFAIVELLERVGKNNFLVFKKGLLFVLIPISLFFIFWKGSIYGNKEEFISRSIWESSALHMLVFSSVMVWVSVALAYLSEKKNVHWFSRILLFVFAPLNVVCVVLFVQLYMGPSHTNILWMVFSCIFTLVSLLVSYFLPRRWLSVVLPLVSLVLQALLIYVYLCENIFQSFWPGMNLIFKMQKDVLVNALFIFSLPIIAALFLKEKNSEEI